MKIETSREQGILVVRLEGEFDMQAAKEFRQIVDAALDIKSGQKIILDFKGVDFIDSSGIGVVLGRYKRVHAYGGEMMLRQLCPQVKNIFQLSGVLKIMQELKADALS
ncbi:MAG: anti-sigma factor antagonist [Sporomusaceae bacterium]|nr:anti-sigma factor antagonist [Sporomusaceae bacterium]